MGRIIILAGGSQFETSTKRMKCIKPKALSKKDRIEILKLWNNEYPEMLNYKSNTDFEKYLESLKKL